MPENDTQPKATEQEPAQEDQEKGTRDFSPISTQEQLDRILGERLSRERAKYAGYDEYKAAAEKLKKIEDANKTELQKLQERAESAEHRVAEFEQREQIALWIQQVAKETGIPAEALRGNTEEEIKAHAEAIMPYFQQQKGSAAPYIFGDGKQPSTNAAAGEDPLRALFKKK